MSRLTKCDKDGVPKLVQYVEYLRGQYLFEATLFDGSKCQFDADSLVQRHVGQTNFPPTNEQFADATTNIEYWVGRHLKDYLSKHAEREWTAQDYIEEISSQLQSIAKEV